MYYKKRLIVWFILAVMTGTAYAAEITDVMVRQRWPWSRKVDIEYVLECQDAGEYDIVIKAYNGNAPLTLPEVSLSGDIHRVRDGARRIVWDPLLTPYVDDGVITNFRVELSLIPVPLYMIIDLTKNLGDPNQIEYVYESDLTNGIGGWGDWERNPVSNDTTVIESVIWTGVTNDNIYRTDKVVLRRVRSGSFGMGEGNPRVPVTLTKDFYIGIYPITQGQWFNVMGSTREAYFTDASSKSFRPMEMVSYYDIRENPSGKGSAINPNWPATNAVGETSFMGVLCAKTGINGFDLPTEAQWEYACRAGTTTYYHDGEGQAPNDGVSEDSAVSNTFMDVLGRYAYNGGMYWDEETGSWKRALETSGEDEGTAIVGTYLPNAWGLYDMHGNVYDWCLDWRGSLTGGTDPVGATSGQYRVLRGGHWYATAKDCRLAYRPGEEPKIRAYTAGFRLLLQNLP